MGALKLECGVCKVVNDQENSSRLDPRHFGVPGRCSSFFLPSPPLVDATLAMDELPERRFKVNKGITTEFLYVLTSDSINPMPAN